MTRREAIEITLAARASARRSRAGIFRLDPWKLGNFGLDASEIEAAADRIEAFKERVLEGDGQSPDSKT